MKKILLLIVFLISLKVSSQVSVYNASLTDTTLKLLYKGIENRIVVMGLENYSDLRISTTEQAQQYQLENNIFLVSINSFKNTIDTLRLYQKDSLILTEIFECWKIPDKVVRLSDLPDTIATVKDILSLINPSLIIVIPGCYWKHHFYVIYFNTTFLRQVADTVKVIDVKSRNSFLSKKHINLIKKLKSGDKIIFDAVASCPYCKLTSMQPLTIVIK